MRKRSNNFIWPQIAPRKFQPHSQAAAPLGQKIETAERTQKKAADARKGKYATAIEIGAVSLA
jgi:hypothetical protein